jgi:hypothetical protein
VLSAGPTPRLSGRQLAELDEIVSTLPAVARAAKMVVMEHSSEESHQWIRDRRGAGSASR